MDDDMGLEAVFAVGQYPVLDDAAATPLALSFRFPNGLGPATEVVQEDDLVPIPTFAVDATLL